MSRLPDGPRLALGVIAALIVASLAITVLFPNSNAAKLLYLFDVGWASSALRLTVPIGFAALGGIFAEKSGVINIGLEGLLIVSAFTGIATAKLLGGGSPSPRVLWFSFFVAVLASTLVSLLFAVVTIDFKADQIIAGLAVWLIALGAAPFMASVIWGSINLTIQNVLNEWTVPVLSQIPVVGPIVFDSNPTVYMLLVAAPLSWYVLNRTRFGYWVRASGENPQALDTAGVDVRRVRYASVLLSGILSGIGGAALTLAQVGAFTGKGGAGGRGWIAITAYLFGNYNPLGAFGASFLFASLQALQFRIQQVGFVSLPRKFVQMVPYVTVIVVLALVGRTRTPDSAGEHYESEE